MILLDKDIALITGRLSKKTSPWITNKIEVIVKQKIKEKARLRNDTTSRSCAYFKMLRNAVNLTIQRDKEFLF